MAYKLKYSEAKGSRDRCRKGYSLIKDELKAYFQGRGSKIPLLPNPERSYYGAMRNRYLAWYAVVQYGWLHIDAAILKGEAINSPGEALIQVLEDEYLRSLDADFRPYYRLTPSKRKTIARRHHHKTEINQEAQLGDRDLAFSQKCIAFYEKKAADDKELSILIQRYYEACDRVAQNPGVSTKKPLPVISRGLPGKV